MARGWSQERLVEIIDDASVGDPRAERITIGTLQNMEAGKPCFVRSVAAVARALGCSVEDLVVPASGDRILAPVCSHPVRAAILTSGNLSYARDISIGFQGHLEQALGEVASRSEFVHVTGPTDPTGNWDYWCRVLERRGGTTGFDYYVTVGTQASCALRDYLREQFGRKPFIFLGVTDPVRSGLVASLTHRQEDGQVTGVGYGPGMGQLAQRIKRLFPSRRLIYVFSSWFPQDKLAADTLRALNLYRNGTLAIVETKELPTADDLADDSAVYFSWYTFELMFEREEGIDLLGRRLVVATTRGNVKGPGLAAVGVGGDDREIGQIGADFVLRHLGAQGLHLGTLDVVVPRLRCWINDKTARELGIELGPDVRVDAEVFT